MVPPTTTVTSAFPTHSALPTVLAFVSQSTQAQTALYTMITVHATQSVALPDVQAQALTTAMNASLTLKRTITAVANVSTATTATTVANTTEIATTSVPMAVLVHFLLTAPTVC